MHTKFHVHVTLFQQDEAGNDLFLWASIQPKYHINSYRVSFFQQKTVLPRLLCVFALVHQPFVTTWLDFVIKTKT